MLIKTIGSENVFEDLGFDKAEAVLLKQKADAAVAIRKALATYEMSQKQAALLLKISRPGLNKIVNGDLKSVSMDHLLKAMYGLGIEAELKIKPVKYKKKVKAA